MIETTAVSPPRRLLTGIRRLQIPFLIWLSIIVLVIFATAAIFADQVAPYERDKQVLKERMDPPALSRGAVSGKIYLLGTDDLGRDVLTRVIHGARISLGIAIVAMIFGSIIGSTGGLLAGFYGKWIDDAIMMLADIQLAIPGILLAIAVIAVLGPGVLNLTIVISITGWYTYARTVRGQVLTVKETDYITAARAIGGSNTRLVFRHVLPNVASAILVIATLDVARVILLESTLSFLGLGIQPPTPSWGNMLQTGRHTINIAWWLTTFPGVALTLVVLSVNQIGDWLRDVLDPALRGAR